jgi:hypothetical protein
MVHSEEGSLFEGPTGTGTGADRSARVSGTVVLEHTHDVLVVQRGREVLLAVLADRRNASDMGGIEGIGCSSRYRLMPLGCCPTAGPRITAHTGYHVRP